MLGTSSRQTIQIEYAFIACYMDLQEIVLGVYKNPVQMFTSVCWRKPVKTSVLFQGIPWGAGIKKCVKECKPPTKKHATYKMRTVC